MRAMVYNSATGTILARFNVNDNSNHLRALAYVRNLARGGANVAGLVAQWFAVSQYIAAKGVTLYTSAGKRGF